MPTTNTKSLFTALIAAQAAMGPVLKEKTNPAFRSKYADLESVLDTVRGPLNENGLVLLQPMQCDEGRQLLITRIVHADTGEWIESSAEVRCADPDNPQKMGGALTYYRRYSILALLGLAPEDDDGQLASQPRPAQQQRQTPVRPASVPSGPEPSHARESPYINRATDSGGNQRVDTSTGEILIEAPHDWTSFWNRARSNGYTNKEGVEKAIGQTMAGKTPEEVNALLDAAHPGATPAPKAEVSAQTKAMKRLHAIGKERKLSHDDLHLLGWAVDVSSLTELNASDLNNLCDWIEEVDDETVASEIYQGKTKQDAEIAKAGG